MKPRHSDISQIKIGPHAYGIVGLRHALEALGETHANLPDDTVAEELLRRLSSKNYIPETAREKYGRAFAREFRKYLGQPFAEEKSELLEIKVLGAGCAVCDSIENQIMQALTEIGLAADLEHIRDADRIAEYRVKATPALIINGKEMTVGAGEVVVMPANIPHSVNAAERFKMLLTVVK